MPVIRGVVSDRLWPLVPLEVSGSTGPFWAVIDTGFEGYLMAPDRERARLRVARTSLMMAGVSADGTASLVPQGRIAIRWFGATIMVRAHVPPATMVDGESHRGDPIRPAHAAR